MLANGLACSGMPDSTIPRRGSLGIETSMELPRLRDVLLGAVPQASNNLDLAPPNPVARPPVVDRTPVPGGQ
jgi:hypothetical protein